MHSLLVSVAIDSHGLILDLLKDLHANILLKPLASTPEGPPDPSVLNAACLTSSSLISWYTESGMSSTGPNNSYPSLDRLALCASGCFSLSCLTTSSVSGNTPPLSSALRYRRAELIWPSMTSLTTLLTIKILFTINSLEKKRKKTVHSKHYLQFLSV